MPRPLANIPGVSSEAERALLQAINALTAEINALKQPPPVTGLKNKGHFAAEKSVVRVRGGGRVAFPRARTENAGDWIVVIIEVVGTVSFTAHKGKVNGSRVQTFSDVGAYAFYSNGVDGWYTQGSLPGTSSGAIATARALSGGIPGDTGEQGEQGIQGIPGPPGPQGPQGLPGADGNDGADGQPGMNGMPGAPGAQGTQGVPGEQGEQGEQGQPGQQGAKGDRGAQGPQGEKGDQGEPGEPGAAGATGATGATGAAGGSLPWTMASEAGAGPFNDYAIPDLSTTNYIILFSGANVQISGFAASGGNVDGYRFGIMMGSSNVGTLLNQSASSIGANRMGISPNRDLDLSERALVWAVYRGGDWRIENEYPPHMEFGTSTGMPATGDIRKGSAASFQIQAANQIVINSTGGDVTMQCASNTASMSGTNCTMTAATTSTVQGGTATITAATGLIACTAANIELDGAVLVDSGGTTGGLLDIAERTTTAPSGNAGRHRIWTDDTAPTHLRVVDDLGQDQPLGFSAQDSVTNDTATSPIPVAGSAVVFSIATYVANELRNGSCFRFFAQVRLIRGATNTATNVTLEFRVNGTQRLFVGPTALQTTASNHDAWIDGYFSVKGAPGAAAPCSVSGWRADDIATAGTVVEASMRAVPGDFTVATNAVVTLDLRCFASAAITATSVRPIHAFIQRIA